MSVLLVVNTGARATRQMFVQRTVQASIDDMRAGKVVPAADVLAEMRRILDGKQGR